VRIPVASAVALVLALGVVAGCGDDEDADGGAGEGSELVLNEAAAVDIDAADEDATETPPQDAAVLDEFAELRQAEGQPSVPAIRGSAGLSVAEWMHVVNGDVATYWQQQFNDAGYEFEPPRELIFDGRTRTECGGRVTQDAGPFYCTLDETIFLPVTFFENVANPFGDAATAIVIAHEEAHRVQDLLGVFDLPILSAQLELQADCLAGVWAKTVYERGLLEEGDIGEILGLVDISGDAPGGAINAPGAHGSSALRQDFFNQGYDGGDPGSCPVPPKREIRGG
jgi:predicted metalloprotease